MFARPLLRAENKVFWTLPSHRSVNLFATQHGWHRSDYSRLQIVQILVDHCIAIQAWYGCYTVQCTFVLNLEPTEPRPIGDRRAVYMGLIRPTESTKLMTRSTNRRLISTDRLLCLPTASRRRSTCCSKLLPPDYSFWRCSVRRFVHDVILGRCDVINTCRIGRRGRAAAA